MMTTRWMKTAFLLTALCLPGLSLAGANLHRGAIAPDWILRTPTGQPLSFYRDSGEDAAVLIFWATWCPYCSKLMPELEQLKRELGNTKVKFYALNIWEDSDPVAHMKEHNYSFDLLLDADSVAKRYGVMGTPGLFVVGADKKILYVRAKGTTAAQARQHVKQVLAAPPKQHIEQ